jgi:ribulose bisphosphate carboxylase small subunit
MKYRIIQYLENQFEDRGNFKYFPTSKYNYVAQYRYKYWPFWFDLCFDQSNKEDALKYIHAHVVERQLAKIIIHEIDPKHL